MKHTNRQNRGVDSGSARTPDRGRAVRCDRAAEWEALLYDYADGLADAQTEREVQRHLAECAYCRGALEDIRWMTAALKESVPEPDCDISARVMKTVRAEQESDGRIVSQSVDAQTGRVLARPTAKRRILRTVGGIAAALVLVIGLVMLLPFLRMANSGAAGTPDILGEMQEGDDDRFHGGVFVGDPGEGTVAQDCPTVLYVPELTEDQLLAALLGLTAEDGEQAEITATQDGYLVTPQSAWEHALEKLRAAYPALEITAVRAETVPASYPGNAFYIQLDEHH